MKTHVIALANHKGGVGKTTSVVNIGAGLARAGRKVLLVDVDPQSNLTVSLGLREAPERTVYDVLAGDAEAGEAVLEHKEGFSFIPSTLDLAGAEIELQSRFGREYVLKEALEPLLGTYEYILLDAPPSLGLLTINALVASTEALVPIQCEFLALHGLTKFLDIVKTVQKANKTIKLGGVIATRYDARKVLNRDVVETLKKNFSEVLFETMVRDNISLAEAMLAGTSVFSYAPKSYGAEDYGKLVEELIQRHNSKRGTQ